MDRSAFWRLIEAAKQESNGKVEQEVDELYQMLLVLPAAEIAEFHNHFWELMDQSYTWDLWAAAYIILGGCSDDAFDYFRGWLIAQGESVFENAMKDPETLVT